MALWFVLVEFVSFLLATLNLRYCAKGHIGKTFATDTLLALNTFVAVKLVASATTPWQVVGYVAGAGLGSLCGMWLTRQLKDV